MDQNDNRPVFRQEVFTGQVLEGAVPGEPSGFPVGEGASRRALGRSEVQDFPSARTLEVLQRV